MDISWKLSLCELWPSVQVCLNGILLFPGQPNYLNITLCSSVFWNKKNISLEYYEIEFYIEMLK